MPRAQRTALRVLALVIFLMSTHADAQDRGHGLLAAAARGDVAQVRELISGGAALDVVDDSGRTPLLIAVANDRGAVAQDLIEAGADINAQAANRDSPWLLAGALGRTEMLAAMLATGRVDTPGATDTAAMRSSRLASAGTWGPCACCWRDPRSISITSTIWVGRHYWRR